MKGKCEFCSGTKIEPGQAGCVWCECADIKPIGERAVEVVQDPAKLTEMIRRLMVVNNSLKERLDSANAAFVHMRQQLDGWVKISERLPDPGVSVLVYTPPQPNDWPDDIRIHFDAIDPDGDGTSWVDHTEHYDHFMSVGGHGCCGPDVVVTGPGPTAPYTHWMHRPNIPMEKP